MFFYADDVMNMWKDGLMKIIMFLLIYRGSLTARFRSAPRRIWSMRLSLTMRGSGWKKENVIKYQFLNLVKNNFGFKCKFKKKWKFHSTVLFFPFQFRIWTFL